MTMNEVAADPDHQMSLKVVDEGAGGRETSAEDGSVEEADKEALVKMQSLFRQVRKQIRSQAGTPKSSILELVQRVKDRQGELTQKEEEQAEERALKEEMFSEVLDKKLDEARGALMAEFEERVDELRRELRTYTEQSLRDLEVKVQRSNLQQESNGPESVEKPATGDRSTRERVLTRTMTTTFPKTSPAPEANTPPAKTQTVTKAKGSQVLMCSKCHQSCRPLPPVAPPLQPRKKWVKAKPKPAK